MHCSALLDAARLGREIDDEMTTRWASDTLHTRSQSHPPSPFAHSIAAGERASERSGNAVRTPCRRVEQIVPSRDNLRGNSTENDGARGVRRGAGSRGEHGHDGGVIYGLAGLDSKPAKIQTIFSQSPYIYASFRNVNGENPNGSFPLFPDATDRVH